MVATSLTYRYWIDAADTITFVNGPWLAFARENGAAELTEASVVGRSLWDFIEGQETKQLYAALIEKVRTQDKLVVVPFRCDSPLVRREMRLLMKQNGEGIVRFESVITQVQPREFLRLFDRTTPRSRTVLDMCSCCKRILAEPVGWTDVDDAVARLHLLAEETMPQLRQTICPSCAQLV